MPDKMSGSSFGVYVHIPFCIQKCRYCDFNTVLRSSCHGETINRYHHAMLLEWGRLQNRIKELTSVKTIYFGGGTPSLYPVDKVQDLLEKIFSHALVHQGSEITMEIDPKTIRRQSLVKLHALGVNRISMGIQSFSDPVLAILGRYHRQKDILACYEDCRSAGFTNISFDLIFGVPGQTLSSWEEDLKWVRCLKPEHVSLYNLNLSRGTDFFRKRKKLEFPDERSQIRMYHAAHHSLKTIGIRPYEISNFSKPGYESRHNMDCWNRKLYVGIGAGASSFHGGKRWQNVKNIHSYIQKIEKGGLAFSQTETLNLQKEKIEYVFLSLRQVKGFDRESYRIYFQSSIEKDFPSLFTHPELNSLIRKKKRIRLTLKGRILSNEVFQELF
ncbi:MAG: radical SAM family heme chaperone HemW [Candidatus Aureabacteria bacterium]|nr:radical SAM family heme chaperone HemW [Candidatus Auribacterota bacterium]